MIKLETLQEASGAAYVLFHQLTTLEFYKTLGTPEIDNFHKYFKRLKKAMEELEAQGILEDPPQFEKRIKEENKNERNS